MEIWSGPDSQLHRDSRCHGGAYTRVEASWASAQRVQESQEVDEQFEVRDGGIGGVVLLTSSYSEAAFENNIGTYLSKKGWVS